MGKKIVQDQFEEEELDDVEDIIDPEEDEEEEVDEAKKASMGDPSLIPDPTGVRAKKLKGSKDQGDKSPPAQGSSKKAPTTKIEALNAMIAYTRDLSTEEALEAFAKMTGEQEEIEEGEKTKERELIKKETEKYLAKGGKIKKIATGKSGMKVSKEDIDVSADLDAVFVGTDISDELKDKAKEIFETAVISKINEKLEELADLTEQELNESTEEFNTQLIEKIDQYLEYVVEQWMKDNELAVEQGIRAEITESFIGGLRDLFEVHYINIPEEKVEVVEDLSAKVDELEQRLNDQIEENISLKEKTEEYERAVVFSEVAEGLTETQIAKFESLSEAVDYAGPEEYAEKLQTIRESYFDKKKSSTNLNEDRTVLDGDPIMNEDESDKVLDPAIGRYVAAISRTVKK